MIEKKYISVSCINYNTFPPIGAQLTTPLFPIL